MPQFSRIPLEERATGDLVAGLIWCSAIAIIAMGWLGSWVLEAGFTLAGLFLLVVLLLFVGVPVTGIVKLARALRKRRHS